MPANLAVTLGDPAGIGPEIVASAVRTLLSSDATVRPVLVGPQNLVEPLAQQLGPRVGCEPQAAFTGALGQASAASGRAALDALMAAIRLAQTGQATALVTAPISKEALAMAGSHDLGHTTILERELARGPVSMAFFSDRLRVALVTAHMPLVQVFQELKPARTVEVATLLHTALSGWLKLPKPRLALAGLNPHAGEGGLMGDDEARCLLPAVQRAQAAGLNLTGPYAADSLFRRAYDGEFDGVVSLYHDQGLIAVKMLGLGNAVHVTLGLKVPRTSPDHGTAFAIAGRGTAKPDAMLAALRAGVELSRG